MIKQLWYWLNGIGIKAICEIKGHDYIYLIGQHHNDTMCRRCKLTRVKIGGEFYR